MKDRSRRSYLPTETPLVGSTNWWMRLKLEARKHRRVGVQSHSADDATNERKAPMNIISTSSAKNRMSKVLARLVSLGCAGAALAACGGGEGDALDGPVWITSGQVVDLNGAPVSGATVGVELDRVYSSSTDSNGRFTLRTPRDYNYPEYFAGYAQKAGHMPGQIFFQYQSGNLASSASGASVTTPVATAEDVFLPAGVSVVHLGDDSFGGAVNSQFQKRAQGIYWEDYFTLAAAASEACVSFFAKGVETETRLDNVISISKNGQPGTFQVLDLRDSPTNGSYENQTHCFSLNGYQVGDRIRVAINSGIEYGDYDDFEFVGVTAKLSLPLSGGAAPVPGGGAGDLYGIRRLPIDVASSGWLFEYSIPQAQATAAQSIGPEKVADCLGLFASWMRAGSTMLPMEDLNLRFFGGVTTPACLRAPNWPAFDSAVRDRAATCTAVPSLGATVLTQNTPEFAVQAYTGQAGPETWSTVINQLERNRANDEASCLAAGGK